MKPRFFETPRAFEDWLARHHASAREQWVGFYKISSGRPSITWPQAVDAALCYGWIDGVRRSLDPMRYAIRFTPRKPRSTWSLVNLRRARALIRSGRMRPAGLEIFQRRSRERSGISSYE